MRKTTKELSLTAALSYITLLGLTVNLDLQNWTGSKLICFIKAFGGFSVNQLILFVGINAFYLWSFQCIKASRWTTRDKACVFLPAILFAIFMVVGYSFAQSGSLDLIMSNEIQVAKSFAMFIGYGIIFAVSIAVLYVKISQWDPFQGVVPKELGKGPINAYRRLLGRAPFRTSFITLLIAYIPYIILFYPGMIMPDTYNQILQGFNFPDGTSNYLNLIEESIKINGHHPVAYTGFIHLCLIFGRYVFGSYNVGLFLVAITQMVTAFVAISLSVCLLNRLGVDTTIQMVFILYFVFSPRAQCYIFVITKDVFSAYMMLIFLLSNFWMIADKAPVKQAVSLSIVSGVGMGLMRNDGKYIILGSIVLAIFLGKKKNRRPLLCSGLVIALALCLFFDLLMPILHITPTSKREVLSVPFQQTARYMREYGNEVTQEEKQAIAEILDVEKIGELYNPELSNPVKGTFNELASEKELREYFKAWFQMGIKHPGVYIQATINNYYNYIYPGAKLATYFGYRNAKICIGWLDENPNLKSIGFRIYHPEAFDEQRLLYEDFRERIFEMPILSMLKSPALYVWALILMCFYALKEKTWDGLALMGPLILSVGICLLGPTNGDYFRYLYGVSVCLPVAVIQLLWFCKHRSSKSISDEIIR